jgi:hypothetical protein
MPKPAFFILPFLFHKGIPAGNLRRLAIQW